MSIIERFNTNGRTIPQIYDALGALCPFMARTSQDSDRFCVLVTQVCDGVAYGYPLLDGKRCRRDWYREDDTESVIIPDQAYRDWFLVDMPYDNVEDVLFVKDLHGSFDEPEETVEDIFERNAPRGCHLNLTGIITFGKYRNRTVSELLHEDPEYASWALDNVQRFRDIAYAG